MPELGLPQSEFASFVRQEQSACTDPYFVEKMAQNLGVELVAVGHEAFLTGLTPEGAKLVAYTHETLSPQEAKSIFWTQKLLATLFPHNFPTYYAAFGSNNSRALTGTIREWIRGRSYFKLDIKRPQLFDPLAVKGQNYFVKYPLTEVKEAMSMLGVDIEFDIGNWDNFLLGPEGGVYYLDKPVLKGELGASKVSKFMNERDYDAGDKNVAQASVSRLSKLGDAAADLRVKL